jgi:hypothetical protein
LSCSLHPVKLDFSIKEAMNEPVSADEPVPKIWLSWDYTPGEKAIPKMRLTGTISLSSYGFRNFLLTQLMQVFLSFFALSLIDLIIFRHTF